MRKRRDFFARLAGHLDLPREALPRGFGAVLSGRHEATAVGCRRILSFSPQKVSLSVFGGVMEILGKDLLCSAFRRGSVTVKGEIFAVHLLEEHDETV